MLRVLAYAPQVLLLVLIAYNTITALWGWSTPPPASRGTRRRRFRVVIPAHDEVGVVGGLLHDLSDQDHPSELVRVVVVADRCTDGTAELARRAGAEVRERDEGRSGKGPALGWYLALEPLARDEALVILDADNRVPPELLSRFSDELDAGHEVLQAYLDVVSPEGSALATASALTYWAGNRMVQLARCNLGWSADLGGTGMCLTADALAAVGGFGSSVTEDQELAARLVLAGHRVIWLHDVRVEDEKPQDLAVAVRQRARWMVGKRDVRRRFLGPLLRQAWHTRSLGPADLALRLVQPGRSFVALATALLAVPAAATPRWLLPWWLWLTTVTLQVLLPLPFLARDGVPNRYLVRYPLVTIVAAMWVPVRIVSGRARGWYHTPHGAQAEPPSSR